jgi:uncharacterized protein YbjT (DUF2867 family)
MTALVIGATGNVGGAVVAGLLDLGVPVRAVSRHEREWPDGVEAVFLMSGYDAEPGLLAVLSDAHVLVLSASSAHLGDGGNAMTAMHLGSERAVKISGLAWTVLRPCSFQSNLLRWRDQLAEGDVVRAPFGDVPVAMIDPADIAAVAVRALTEPGHRGATYRISGPEPLTPAEQVERLGAALDRPLSFEAVPDSEAQKQLGAYADAMVEIFRGHPDLESEVQHTVEDLLGRPPAPLTDWLAAHRHEF